MEGFWVEYFCNERKIYGKLIISDQNKIKDIKFHIKFNKNICLKTIIYYFILKILLKKSFKMYLILVINTYTII